MVKKWLMRARYGAAFCLTVSPFHTVESREPNRAGMKWEQSFSSTSQSAMMVLVRSARSRLPKKDRGSLRSRSARVKRRVPLSL